MLNRPNKRKGMRSIKDVLVDFVSSDEFEAKEQAQIVTSYLSKKSDAKPDKLPQKDHE